MNSTWNFATIIKRLLGSVLGSLLALALTGCSSYFFYPQKQLVRTPMDVDIDYEDVYVTTRDQVKLHGWLLKAQQPKGIVFFLHGNAENISTHLASVFWLPSEGYDVLLMDYRGYGNSEGSPGFPQVFWDVDAFYSWLTDYAEQSNLPVTVLGQSLGAAIGSYYFSQLPADDRIIQGVVLDAVFSGHKAIAKEVLRQNVITWPLQFIVPAFLPDEYNPRDHVAGLAPTPILFFHSPDDKVLPYDQGREVYEHASPPKHWVTTHGPHIATFSYPSMRQVLLDFLNAPGQPPKLQVTH